MWRVTLCHVCWHQKMLRATLWNLSLIVPSRFRQRRSFDKEGRPEHGKASLLTLWMWSKSLSAKLELLSVKNKAFCKVHDIRCAKAKPCHWQGKTGAQPWHQPHAIGQPSWLSASLATLAYQGCALFDYCTEQCLMHTHACQILCILSGKFGCAH